MLSVLNMNALEIIEESERVAYAMGVSEDQICEFTQWVITLRWPNWNKEKECIEYGTLEELRQCFKDVKAHPKNVKSVP